MVAVLDRLELKAIGETVAGELYRMELRDGFATCVTLEREEQGPFLIGVLSSEEVDRPSYLVNPHRTARCASFGLDWLIEPMLGKKSFPHHRYVHEDVGLLFLQEEDAILRFDKAPNPSDFESLNASLLGLGRVERANDAVPYERWRIWQSADARNRPGARPILEMGGEA